MYTPAQFAVTDRQEVLRFIRANGFGQLISHLGGRLYSSHIPFLLSDDRTRLLGHLARGNPQWRDINGQDVMVTLEGPHGYVSPTWYNSPGVPTWNYQAVHVYGRCEVIEATEQLRSIVEALAAQYEAGSAQPWTPDYEPAMLRGIVGISVRIDEIHCKYKLSQNRPMGDRVRVVERFEAMGQADLAGAMREWSMR